MQIDSPDAVRPINSQAELLSLCSTIGHTPDADFHFAEQEALAGDLLHLRPQEVLCVPFLLQVFKGASAEALPAPPPEGTSAAAMEATHHAPPDDLRTVTIKLVQRATGDEVPFPLIPPPADCAMCSLRMQAAARMSVISDTPCDVYRCLRTACTLSCGGRSWTGRSASTHPATTSCGRRSN